MIFWTRKEGNLAGAMVMAVATLKTRNWSAGWTDGRIIFAKRAKLRTRTPVQCSQSLGRTIAIKFAPRRLPFVISGGDKLRYTEFEF